MEHKIQLIGGFTDKEDIVHDEVTFGKRLTARDLMDLDNDPQAANPTQYQDLIRRKMITKFGSLKMPVTLNALLALDSIDREDLGAAADKFLAISRGERTSEFRENNEVKLFFGFEIDGMIYDVVQFGNRTTGRDEVAADAVGNGIARVCFLIGQQISRISTSDGLASIDGKIDLKQFESLDAEDMNLLRIGAKMWRLSFRLRGKTISGERDGDDRVPAGERDENVGNGNPQPADGTH